MRIAVLGNSGSGKSRFSAWLGSRLGIPVHHVDMALWLPGWKQREALEFQDEIASWVEKTSWLIDGVGPREMLQTRLDLAHRVILIDAPLEECLQNARRRAADESLGPNQFVQAGLHYSEVTELRVRVIQSFEADWMPWLRETAKTHAWITYPGYRQAYEDPRWGPT